ncbi:hypothetical protein VTJ83DRAFT_5509 [Remersonia thermophila]|uniref:Terpene synthase n=1 Tax=Remersonia thermophila TaxID=72144 RepID=A0ABR4D798_9PEZI
MADIGLFAAGLFPDAPYDALETAAFYNIWLFLWDDAIDGSGGRELSDADEYSRRSAAFVEHALRCADRFCFCSRDGRPHAPPAPTRTCASFSDVAGRIRAAAGERRPDDLVELAGRLREYMEGCVAEHRARVTGAVPSVEEFYSWRLKTSSTEAFLVLTRILNDITLPHEIFRSKEHVEMGVCVNKLLILINELFSLKKELKDGAFGNLLPITMRELGTDLEGAVHHIIQDIDRCIQDYDRHASTMRSAAAQRHPESLGQVEKLIAAYQCIATAVLNFSINSPRYGLAKYRQADGSFLVEL